MATPDAPWTPCSRPTWRARRDRRAPSPPPAPARSSWARALRRYRFLDDQPDPFVVNPHFKAWAPVLDPPVVPRLRARAAGRRCCFTSPRTTGTSRRRCRRAPGWTLRRARPAQSRRGARARARRAPPTSASPSPAARSGASPRSTRRRCSTAALRARHQDRPTNSPACGARRRRRARPPGGGARLRGGRLRVRDPPRLPRGRPGTREPELPYPNIIALQRGRGDPPLPAT